MITIDYFECLNSDIIQNNWWSAPRTWHEAREARNGVYALGTRVLKQPMNTMFVVG